MGTLTLNHRILGLALVIAAVALAVFSSLATVRCHPKGDCVKYTSMNQAFHAGKIQVIEYPFNLRALAPWLAFELSSDTVHGFQILNATAAFIWVIATYFIFVQLELGLLEFAFFILWFFLHPLGFRLYTWDPASVDPLSYALLSVAILIFFSGKRLFLWPVILIGLMAKESFLFVALCMLFGEFIYAILVKSQRKYLVLNVLAFVAVFLCYRVYKKYIVSHHFPPLEDWRATPVQTIRFWLEMALEDHNRFVVWIASFFVSTGVTLGLVINKIKMRPEPLQSRNLAFLLAGAGGYFAFGLTAGADMSRIIFNGNEMLMLFFIYFAHLNQVPKNQKYLFFGLSFTIGLSYMLYFPDMFEYGYYESHNILPTELFLMAAVAVLIAGLLVRQSTFFVRRF